MCPMLAATVLVTAGTGLEAQVCFCAVFVILWLPPYKLSVDQAEAMVKGSQTKPHTPMLAVKVLVTASTAVETPVCFCTFSVTSWLPLS